MVNKKLRFRPRVQILEKRACLTAAVAVFTPDSLAVSRPVDEVGEVADRPEAGARNSASAAGVTFDGTNVTLDISSVSNSGPTGGDHDIVHLHRLARPESPDAASPSYNPYITIDYIEDIGGRNKESTSSLSELHRGGDTYINVHSEN